MVQGVKLPLPPEARHPEWVRVSARTFISRKFVQLHAAAFQTSHTSVEGFTAAHNSIVLDSFPAREGGAFLISKCAMWLQWRWHRGTEEGQVRMLRQCATT